MSIHKSLKSKRFEVVRTVRKRWERIEKLNRTKKWVDGMSVYGLPKEKIVQIKLKIEKEKLTEEEKSKLNPDFSVISIKKGKKKTSKDVTGIR